MTALPPRRIAAAVAALAAVAVVLAVYAVFDPCSPWFPRCMFHTLTQLDCPGCGAQRAVHALLGGRLAEACGYNALLVCAGLPYLALLGTATAARSRCPRLFMALTSPRAGTIVLAVVLLWWVARNIINI